MKNERILEYTAVIERDGDSYSVYFPDVPGCFTQGKTVEEAEARAQQALEAHLGAVQDAGEELPEPSAHVAAVRVKAS